MRKMFLVTALCCSTLLGGCGQATIDSEVDTSVYEEQGMVDFSNSLVWDKDTKIVYIYNRTYYGYAVYTNYYSENGKLCRYIDGKIVEVE